MNPDYAQFLLEKTCQDYNLIADDFSSKRREIWEETKFLFDKHLTAGEKVLDLGCGNGRYYPLFKEKNVDYLGADISEKLIGIAKRKYPHARFQVTDALDLPFSDNSFDKIYSIAVLHHIPSENFRLHFLKETKRVLKQKGLLILTAWKFRQPKERYFLFKYTLLKLIGKSKLDWRDVFEPWGKKAQRYYHCFSKKELEGLMRKAGFEIKESGIVKNEKGNRQNIFLVAQKPL